jgi:hypothetical protein
VAFAAGKGEPSEVTGAWTGFTALTDSAVVVLKVFAAGETGDEENAVLAVPSLCSARSPAGLASLTTGFTSALSSVLTFSEEVLRNCSQTRITRKSVP